MAATPAVYFPLGRPKKAHAYNPVREVPQVVGRAERRSSWIADKVVPAFVPPDHPEMVTAVREWDQRNDGISPQQIRIDQFVGRTTIVGQFQVRGRDQRHPAPINQPILVESTRSGQESI